MDQPAYPPITRGALNVIHKVIRAELFSVSACLARADQDNLPQIQQALAEIAQLLRGHGEHEDRLFEQQLRDYDPMFANILEDDHLRLEAALAGILEQARQLAEQPDLSRQLHYLYLNWNRFVAEYLLHLDDEERRLFVAIGEQMPPLGVISASLAALTDDQRQRFIQKLKQVSTAQEQLHIFHGYEHHKEPA